MIVIRYAWLIKPFDVFTQPVLIVRRSFLCRSRSVHFIVFDEETVEDVEFLFECHIEDLQAKQTFLSRQLSIFDRMRMRLF